MKKCYMPFGITLSEDQTKWFTIDRAYSVVYIDTVKEFVTLSNISLDALTEIETRITSFMMEAKKQYPHPPKDKDEEEK